MPQIEIKDTFGHYEVYIDGKFYCSADSYKEAVKELTTQNEFNA